VVAGGVGANQLLREQLDTAAPLAACACTTPLHLCTDNGAMIALAAAMRVQAGVEAPRADYAFDVRPRWPLHELTAA
jgi:N6-L-threonylcarbamoyladenine synthase